MFALGMATLASVYERLEKIASDEVLSEQWYRMLSDLSNEQFKYAVEAIIKTQKFAPTIADIREKALEYGREDELSSEEAWLIVINDVRKFGSYREPKYQDWKLEAAKNAIGWQSLCDMTEENKSIIRAQFMRIYDSFKNRQRQLELMNNEELEKIISKLARKLNSGSDEPRQALPG